MGKFARFGTASTDRKSSCDRRQPDLPQSRQELIVRPGRSDRHPEVLGENGLTPRLNEHPAVMEMLSIRHAGLTRGEKKKLPQAGIQPIGWARKPSLLPVG